MTPEEREEIRARYTSTPFGQLDKAEQDAIIVGLDFVDGAVVWPSSWADTFDYQDFTYNIRPNAMGWAVYYQDMHIGQLKWMKGVIEPW